MSTQQELINIKKHNYKSYVNSQIILADVKLTNSEKQVRDGGHRSEERCIVLIDTDQIANKERISQVSFLI